MSKVVKNILSAICVLVIVVCLGVVGFVALTYYKSSHAYDELRQYKVQESVTSNDNPKMSKIEKTLASMKVDWDSLKSQNEDTVAWITVEGTRIDYPVVQGKDNDQYLHEGFDGSWSANGAVFLDYEDPSDFSSYNSMLYGHHMRDGSMFASLASLASQENFDSCGNIYLLSPKKNMYLKPTAFLDVSGDDSQVGTRPKTAKGEAKYVKEVMNRAMCKAEDVDPSDISQTIGLMTCDELGNDGRYLLVCSIEAEVSME